MEIYLDLVVLLNFLVDFLLLLGTNRLAGFHGGLGRCAAAAALGSLYAAVCLLPGLSFLGNPLWRMVWLGLLGMAAFGWNRSALKRGAVFLILSMSLGGIGVCLGSSNFSGLVLCALLCWLLCRLAFGEQIGGREYVPLTLTYAGETVGLIALRDTGNQLRDPVSGEPVLVISGDVGCRLTGLTMKQLRSPMETMLKAPVPGLRLIPYRAVGQGGSFLLGLRMDRIKLNGRECSAVVAFAPEGLEQGSMYQALAGGI